LLRNLVNKTVYLIDTGNSFKKEPSSSLTVLVNFNKLGLDYWQIIKVTNFILKFSQSYTVKSVRGPPKNWGPFLREHLITFKKDKPRLELSGTKLLFIK